MPSEAAPALQLDVRRVLPDFELVARTEVALDGVTGLFGPSGSGKTSLLRLIAGFDSATLGVIRCGDETWVDVSAGINIPAWQRGAGYLFQDARLFEHLDVTGNLRFAKRRAQPGGPEAREVVDALDLGPLLGRPVAGLSGGERQRVALARTLLSNPRLLLLDEPLAALDARRKNDIIPYLESLPRRFGIPAVYVSHAVDEIVRLAERVIVLEAGRVRAAGETTAVMNELTLPLPATRFEMASILEASVVQHWPDLWLTELAVAGQAMFVPLAKHLAVGASQRIRVRAGDVALSLDEPRRLSFRNILAGTLVDLAQHTDSPFATAVIDIGDARLRCQLTRQAVIELELRTGMAVFALVKTASFADYAPPDDADSLSG